MTVSNVWFEVPYRASLFPPPFNGAGALLFTDADLAHALFTTGRAPGDEFAYGTSSLWEFLHRSLVIPAYVRRGTAGALVKSTLALSLDRSEKGALSYALGQAMTAIFCDAVIGATRLMHVERYVSRFNVAFATGARPDLIGQAPSGWIVAEAKGRSNGMERSLRTTLAAQKSAIASIDGAPPSLALGCVASFPTKTRQLRVDAFDPDLEQPEGVELTISPDRFVLAYYEPFRLAIDSADETNLNDGIVSAPVRGSGVRVGLNARILEQIRAARQGSIDGLAERVAASRGEPSAAEDGLFPDGSWFATDWEESLLLDDIEEA